jgi:hypothetical protein
VKEVEYGWCTLYVYENRTMKSCWTYSKKGGGEMRENDGNGALIKMHCKHICKCHNEIHQHN